MKSFKRLKLIDGFTFIEALITIVIVGIVIIPITTIFANVIKDNIEAKERLRITQLAQLYMENIKAKSEVDFMTFFQEDSESLEPEGQRTIEENEGYYIGFPNIPKGYKVRLSYDKGVDFLGFENSIDPDEPILNYDASITFDYNIGKNLKVNNNVDEVLYLADTTIQDRIINIIYNEFDVQILDGNMNSFYVQNGTHLDILNDYNNIRIELKDTKDYTPFFNTRIYVQNYTIKPVNLYIFEADNHTVNLSINDGNANYGGETKIFYNMVNNNPSSHKVYKIIVEILDENNQVLTKLEGTKIDE